MNATTVLNRSGQSLWLDNITRDLLDSGTLVKYIAELSVTGLTSNPTIYEKAVSGSDAYDEQIRSAVAAGHEGEALFFELALSDLRQAADAFAETHQRTSGVDGWVSLEVSPLLARKTEETIAQAVHLHGLAERPNLYIKIPGTPEGLPAIEEAIFRGVPVNVTLLFSAEHYLAAADAYMRGLERRIEAGLDVAVASVASVFMSRWDGAVANDVPDVLRNKLGLAIGAKVYAAYREVIASDRWQRLANEGGRPQRLLFASTGTKDPEASDVLYITGFAAPQTVNTMPEATLLAFADHGAVEELLGPDGGHSQAVLESFASAGVAIGSLGQKLQDDGADAFVKSWTQLMELIVAKTAELVAAG